MSSSGDGSANSSHAHYAHGAARDFDMIPGFRRAHRFPLVVKELWHVISAEASRQTQEQAEAGFRNTGGERAGVVGDQDRALAQLGIESIDTGDRQLDPVDAPRVGEVASAARSEDHFRRAQPIAKLF